jgi:ribosomal protection tetracycline resistance protein
VRMFSGTVRTRDRVRLGERGGGKVTAIGVFEGGSAVRRASVSAGEIAKLWGLASVRIGDAVGEPRMRAEHHFAPPTLETVVVPRCQEEKGALHAALTQLAEQDPLIDLRQDDVRQELFVSLYGEVQKEVIQATLASDYGLDVGFHESTTICVERPLGTGAAAELAGKGNPFVATVGLRIDPAPAGSGVRYRVEVEMGSMPAGYHKAVEDAVRETLRQGLYGWQVTDCTVSLTHSAYPAGSTTADSRNLTPLVLMSALKRAGTVVCEPIHRFQLEFPADTLGSILAALARLEAVPASPAMRGSSCTLEGTIRVARVHELQQQLRGLTRGEGVLESAFEHYEAVRGSPPKRRRTDRNPLNRDDYLLHLSRAV